MSRDWDEHVRPPGLDLRRGRAQAILAAAAYGVEVVVFVAVTPAVY